MQDLLDHGEARKKQEDAEFARIDAEAKDERDKEAGLRGKVRPLHITTGRERRAYPTDLRRSGWPGCSACRVKTSG